MSDPVYQRVDGSPAATAEVAPARGSGGACAAATPVDGPAMALTTGTLGTVPGPAGPAARAAAGSAVAASAAKAATAGAAACHLSLRAQLMMPLSQGAAEQERKALTPCPSGRLLPRALHRLWTLLQSARVRRSPR